jgi:Na+-driven multidrug efflux pump
VIFRWSTSVALAGVLWAVVYAGFLLHWYWTDAETSARIDVTATALLLFPLATAAIALLATLPRSTESRLLLATMSVLHTMSILGPGLLGVPFALSALLLAIAGVINLFERPRSDTSKPASAGLEQVQT